MKLSDLLGNGAPVVIKNINIINTAPEKEDSTVVNPGIEYGEDDKAKWSPPLQQELSIMKSAVGVTPDVDTTDLNSEPVQQAVQQAKVNKVERSDDQVELIKKLVAILGK